MMIPTSQLQEIKKCFASHLLRLLTSLPYLCPSFIHHEHQLLGATHRANLSSSISHLEEV